MIEALFGDYNSEDDGAPKPGSAWEARIAATPLNGGVEVTIPSYSTKHRFGPCPYMARAALDPSDPPDEPIRGDRALVVFDENSDPWVVCWTPD